MSNHLAIATVTATLRQMLASTADECVPGAAVTTMRPDAPGNGTVDPRVNLYLYQVTPNAAWRNSDLPTRNTDGHLTQRARAALDLHYLVTFYGNEVELEPQRLLGGVARTLHARPMLERTRIRDTVSNPTFASFLGGSDLAEDVELVKFTPLALNLEELAKLWSVFFQTQYALSVAYLGTVVLIETDHEFHAPLPVRQRNLYVIPLKQPLIDAIQTASGAAGEPIRPDSTIAIRGRRLLAEVTQVRIDGEETPTDAISNTEIRLKLPPLRTGVHAVQVVHQALMGTPPMPHRGTDSNVAAFVLPPIIAQDANGAYRISADLQQDESSLLFGTLTVEVAPLVGKDQRATLLLNETEREAVVYHFKAEPRDVDSTTVSFVVSSVEAGTYFVRVQIDGIASVLEYDPNPPTPGFREPKITLS